MVYLDYYVFNLITFLYIFTKAFPWFECDLNRKISYNSQMTMLVLWRVTFKECLGLWRDNNFHVNQNLVMQQNYAATNFLSSRNCQHYLFAKVLQYCVLWEGLICDNSQRPRTSSFKTFLDFFCYIFLHCKNKEFTKLTMKLRSCAFPSIHFISYLSMVFLHAMPCIATMHSPYILTKAYR